MQLRVFQEGGVHMEKIKKVVNKKQVFTTCFWGLVLIGVIGGYLFSHDEIDEAMDYLREMNVAVLILLIPAVVLMYYTAGRIWYPYLKEDGLKPGTLGRVQYELNFVNTVVPFFSISGLVYALARLKQLGVSEGKASGMYMFRYIISIATKWIEIAIAMALLVWLGQTGEMSEYVVWITCVLVIAITALFTVGLILFLKRVQVPDRLLESPKYGKTAAAAQEQLENLFVTLVLVFSQIRALLEASCWGLAYSLLEVIPFWVVATAMGHPELLLQIVVASGIAITVGVVIPTPMGIGGFDGAMILFMGGMGQDIAFISMLVIVTRVLILVGTAVTGIPFWMDGMRKISNDINPYKYDEGHE